MHEQILARSRDATQRALADAANERTVRLACVGIGHVTAADAYLAASAAARAREHRQLAREECCGEPRRARQAEQRATERVARGSRRARYGGGESATRERGRSVSGYEVERIAEVRVPRLLSIAEVAEIVGRSPKTARRRISDGSLLAVVEHGQLMVRGDELRAYIDGLQRPRNGRPRLRRQTIEPYARLAA